jgi:hypothetical protein
MDTSQTTIDTAHTPIDPPCSLTNQDLLFTFSCFSLVDLYLSETRRGGGSNSGTYRGATSVALAATQKKSAKFA